jgi:hypothetical protein
MASANDADDATFGKFITGNDERLKNVRQIGFGESSRVHEVRVTPNRIHL